METVKSLTMREDIEDSLLGNMPGIKSTVTQKVVGSATLIRDQLT